MTSSRSVRSSPTLRLLLVAVVALIGACTTARSNDGGVPPDAEIEVTIEGIAFEPDRLEVKAGERVRWVNKDEVDHTVTSGKPGRQGIPGVSEGTSPKLDGLFDSPLERVDSSFTYTFEKPGTYVYFCRIHAAMKAVVIVE